MQTFETVIPYLLGLVESIVAAENPQASISSKLKINRPEKNNCFRKTMQDFSGVPYLPLEMVAHVLHFLSIDKARGVAALANCALVCPAWRLISQKLLYSGAVVKFDLRQSDFGRLERCLGASPHLLPLIRNILILVDSDCTEQRLLDRPVLAMGLLGGVQRLQLKGTGAGIITGTSWGWFEGAFEQALDDLLALPSLTHLIVESMNFWVDTPAVRKFHRALSQAKSLAYLELVEIGLPSWDEDFQPPLSNPATHHPSISLKSLTIRALGAPHNWIFGHEFWEYFLAPFNLPSLTTLCISHHEPYLCHSVSKATSLEELIIVSEDSDSSFRHPVDLSRIPPVLSTIRIDFPTNRPPATLLVWIERTITTIPLSNRITSFHFTIRATHSWTFPSYQLGTFHETQFAASWASIGQILSSGACGSLKTVEISIYSPVWSPVMIANAVRFGLESGRQENGCPYVIEISYIEIP